MEVCFRVGVVGTDRRIGFEIFREESWLNWIG